jgi:pantoate kinase
VEYDSREAAYRATIRTLEADLVHKTAEKSTIENTHAERISEMEAEMAEQHCKLPAALESVNESRKRSSGLALCNVELKSELEDLQLEHGDLLEKWSPNRRPMRAAV